jgi:hypothetical protein
VIPIGLVIIHHPLEHGFKDFIDDLNLAIPLENSKRMNIGAQDLIMKLDCAVFHIQSFVHG